MSGTDFEIEYLKRDVYLGDGVYVSFDGYQIWLAVNDHRNKVVALEPAVMDALASYYSALKQAIKSLESITVEEPPHD